MNPQQKREQELQKQAYYNQPIRIGDITQNLVYRTAQAIRELAETLQYYPGNPNNRKRLLALLEVKRHEFMRLFVIVKYARTFSESFTKLHKMNEITLRNERIFIETVQKLHETWGSTSVHAYPMWDVSAALHVMTTGSYRLLPKVMEDAAAIKKDMPENVAKGTMRRLNDKTWIRLLATRMPPQINQIRVKAGTAFLRVADEFEIEVSLRMRPSEQLLPPESDDRLEDKNNGNAKEDSKDNQESRRVQWVLLNLNVFISEKDAEYQLVPKQQLELLRDWLNRITYVEREPVMMIYNRLHIYCMRLSLALLRKQATLVTRSRFGPDCVLLHKKHKEIKIDYWPNAPEIPVEGQLLNGESKSMPDIKEPSGAISLSISIDRHDMLAITHNPPLEEIRSGSKESIKMPRLCYSNLDLDRLVEEVVILHANKRVADLKRFIERTSSEIRKQYFEYLRIVQGEKGRKCNTLEIVLTNAYKLSIKVHLRTGKFMFCWLERSTSEKATGPWIKRLLSGVHRRLEDGRSDIITEIKMLRVQAVLEQISDICEFLGVPVSRCLTAHWPRTLRTPFGPYSLYVNIERWPGHFLGINVNCETLRATAWCILASKLGDKRSAPIVYNVTPLTHKEFEPTTVFTAVIAVHFPKLGEESFSNILRLGTKERAIFERDFRRAIVHFSQLRMPDVKVTEITANDFLVVHATVDFKTKTAGLTFVGKLRKSPVAPFSCSERFSSKGYPLPFRAVATLEEVQHAQKDASKWNHVHLRSGINACEAQAPIKFMEQQLRGKKLSFTSIRPNSIAFASPPKSGFESLRIRIDIAQPELAPRTTWTAFATHQHFVNLENIVTFRPRSLVKRNASRKTPVINSECSLIRMSISKAKSQDTGMVELEYGKMTQRMINTLIDNLASFREIAGFTQELLSINSRKPGSFDTKKSPPPNFFEVQEVTLDTLTVTFAHGLDIVPHKLTVTAQHRGEGRAIRLKIAGSRYPQTALFEEEVEKKHRITTVLEMIYRSHKFVKCIEDFCTKMRQVNHPALLGQSDTSLHGIFFAQKAPERLLLTHRWPTVPLSRTESKYDLEIALNNAKNRQDLDIAFESVDRIYVSHPEADQMISLEAFPAVIDQWVNFAKYGSVQKIFEQHWKSDGQPLIDPITRRGKSMFNLRLQRRSNSYSVSVTGPQNLLRELSTKGLAAKSIIEATFTQIMRESGPVQIHKLWNFVRVLACPRKLLEHALALFEVNQRPQDSKSLQIKVLLETIDINKEQKSIKFFIEATELQRHACAFVKLEYNDDFLYRVTGDSEDSAKREAVFGVEESKALREHLEKMLSGVTLEFIVGLAKSIKPTHDSPKEEILDLEFLP
mmetsp:Transcript_11251/g.27677  ORF Transcript_11251/g.27677 Transcript_11251/m.27677 type:complete len:1351 (+) Transcript_11251:131-4183(+)